MPNFFGNKAVPDKLKKELDARRDVKTLQEWYASKVTWVHLTSMCAQCDSSIINLSGLKNTAYEDKDAYGGMRPNPVITGVKVTAQGNLGTTRKASINLIAFTEEQLEKVANCYLVSGMSVRVEFGWSVGAYNDERAPAPISLGRDTPDSKVICAINKQRDNYPMYDGLQGIVGKYDIKYNKEAQYWEITIDMIAASSPVLTLPLRNAASTCICEEKQEDPTTGKEEPVEVERSALDSFIHELVRIGNEDSSSDAAAYTKKAIGLEKAACVLPLNASARNTDGTDVQPPMWRRIASTFFSSVQSPELETQETYISLEGVFKAIEKLSFTESDSGKESIYCKFDLSLFGRGTRKKPYLVSADPHVCLFPGGDQPTNNAYTGIEDMPSCILSPDGTDLGKILVNAIFLSSILTRQKNKPSVEDFLSEVLSGINRASGNLWELTVVDTADCSQASSVPVMSVIDVSRKGNDFGEYVVVGKAKNKVQPAIIRDISLQLKLTAAMQSRALYASTRTEVTEDPCTDKQFSKDQKDTTNLAAPKAAEPKQVDCGKKCNPPDKSVSAEEAMLKSLRKAKKELTQAHKDDLYTKLMKYYNQDAQNSQCREMIVPYELSLTFDGIGGFSFGQMVNCDLVPEKVRNRYSYQIIEVSHDLSYGDWTTSIKCVARYKPS